MGPITGKLNNEGRKQKLRLVTYQPAAGIQRLGLLMDGKVMDLALARDAYLKATQHDIPIIPPDMMAFLAQGDFAIKAAQEIAAWAKTTGSQNRVPRDLVLYDIDSVRLCAPVPRPSKILCLGLNYASHVKEVKDAHKEAKEVTKTGPDKPFIFSKPGTGAVVGHGDKVIRPLSSKDFVYEGELAIVIGRRCRRVSKEKAYEVIAGYTAVNDVTARDLGIMDIPGLPGMFDWFRAKSWDTALPMGPCLTLKDEIKNPHGLRLTVKINGQITQDASTDDMTHKIPEIIEFVSEILTLEPGDIIATGTPAAMRSGLKAGDRIDVEITGIGTLSNTVADAEE
jgi:2-keto-4-pentenoate hydratase/2-oxohepta-3-ene-1,7-dioic acid hydratase in catechol pathway